jgi:hypothetical protein
VGGRERACAADSAARRHSREAQSEEAPAALLLAHAAYLSSRKRLNRKAALLYLTAANRLEKCGIVRRVPSRPAGGAELTPAQKPLTMHFLRCAHALYARAPDKGLSPAFWDGAPAPERAGFGAVRPGIDAALARLLYTSGRVEDAVRIYVRLLAPTAAAADGAPAEAQQREQVLLDDFDVALKVCRARVGAKKCIERLSCSTSCRRPGAKTSWAIYGCLSRSACRRRARSGCQGSALKRTMTFGR